MNDAKYGMVSAGHQQTAEATWIILQEGGNAFDAALAGILAACVAESASISIGGGGFLLAHSAKGRHQLYDFFTQTPRQKTTHRSLDFFPIDIDFKDNSQQFHVGLATAATPGIIAGLYEIHSELGSIPFEVIAEPALELAKNGLQIDDFQQRLLQIVFPIIEHSITGKKCFLKSNGTLKRKGDKVKIEGLADTLYVLAKEGPREFYQGEIAKRICRDSQELGGHFTPSDFRDYKVIRRKALELDYRGYRFLTNPPPSAGGILIGFCLELLKAYDLQKMNWKSNEYMQLMIQVMNLMNFSRKKTLDNYLQYADIAQHFLKKEHIDSYLQSLNKKTSKLGSTTQISVVDKNGNAASTTISSGAGNSYYIPRNRNYDEQYVGRSRLES